MSDATRSRRAQTAMTFLDALDREGIDHCILRNHEQVPVEPGRDIDLIADDRSLPRAEGILVPIAQQAGWHNLVRCTGHHEGTSYYLTRTEGTWVEQLEFHFTRIRWAGIPVLTPQDLITRRTRAPSGLWISDPIHTAIQRIMQFGLSGQVMDMKPEYWDATRRLAGSRGIELVAELEKLTGSSGISHRLIHAVAADEREEAAELLVNQRRSFVISQTLRHPIATLAGFASAVSRRAGESKPAFCGVVVATQRREVVPGLMESIDPLFLRVVRYEAEELDREAVNGAKEIVKNAGAVIVTTDEPELEVTRSSWGGTAVAVDDLSSVGAVVQRFIDNHEQI